MTRGIKIGSLLTIGLGLALCGPVWSDEMDECRQALLEAEGFDVLQVWASGGQIKRQQLLSLVQSSYKDEGLNLARSLHWLSENKEQSRKLFQRLLLVLENCPLRNRHGDRYTVPAQRTLLSQELARITPDFASVPSEFWELIAQWFEASNFPHRGRGPSRNDVLTRIKAVVFSADIKEKVELFNASIQALGITVVGNQNHALNSQQVLLLDKKYRLIERKLQQVVFSFDQVLNIIPQASYAPAGKWYARWINHANRWIRGASAEEGIYQTREDLERELKTIYPWLKRFKANKFAGVDLEPFPLAKRLVLRTVATALAGTLRPYPNPSELQKEFAQFLRTGLSILSNQLESEQGELLEESLSEPLEAGENRIAETATTEEAIKPVGEKPLVPPDVKPKTKRVSEANKKLVEKEEAKRGQSDAYSEPVPPFLPGPRERPSQRVEPEDALDRQWEAVLPTLELTTAECLSLMEDHAASPWHAKIIRKQMEEVQRHHSEAVFDREIQSIAAVLLKLSGSSRLQAESFGRSLKKLSQKNLLEIKPQGRSTLRVIFGLNADGLKLLRVLPRSKNNANETARKLNDLEGEWASLSKR